MRSLISAIWAPAGESGSAPAPTAEQSGDMDASTSNLDRLDALLEAAKLTEEAEDDVEEAAFDALLATVQEKVQKEQEDGESDAEMELAAVGQITSIKIKMSPLAAGTDLDLSHSFLEGVVDDRKAANLQETIRPKAPTTKIVPNGVAVDLNSFLSDD
jgi:hypothetical protein